MPDSLNGTGTIILLGGTNIDPNNVVYFNDLHYSSDRGLSWQLIFGKTSLWGQNMGRFGHTCIVRQNGDLIVMGGKGYMIHNEVLKSTDLGLHWTTTHTNPWGIDGGRYGHTSVVLHDGSIIVMGGHASITPGVVVKKDVWRLDPATDLWTLSTDSAWGGIGRADHSSEVTDDGTILLMGGVGLNQLYFNEVWKSSDQGKSWNIVSSSAWSTGRIVRNSVTLPSSKAILVLGGYDAQTGDGYLNEVWKSIDMGESWTEIRFPWGTDGGK